MDCRLMVRCVSLLHWKGKTVTRAPLHNVAFWATGALFEIGFLDPSDRVQAISLHARCLHSVEGR